jgi:hypothetical protein
MDGTMSRAVRYWVAAGIALAGIGLLNNLSAIILNAATFWVLAALLVVIAAICFARGVWLARDIKLK